MRRTLAFIPVLIVIALMATALPAAARAPIAIGVSNPDGGGPDLAEVKAAVFAHRAEAGVYPRLWSLWSRWGDRGGSDNCVAGSGSCAFPKEASSWLLSKGITPVIWWLPLDPKNWEAGKYERYKRTLRGKHDPYIKKWARDLRDTSKAHGGKRIIVRYAHEATGHWFPWAIGRFDNTKENYKQAWRYLYWRFKGQGALPYTRFLWSMVWPFAWAYPGDKYIHYVGITVLNFGAQRKWKGAKKLIDQRGKASVGFSKRPIIVAEIASHYKGGSKPKWLGNAYWHTYKNHPRIKAIMYLDTNEPHIQRGQPDWRLVKPDNGAALTKYQNIAKNPKFRGKLR